MINISLSYDMILKLEIYMEREIKDIRQCYDDYSQKYQETCAYNRDKSEIGRSFSTDYGITKEEYEEYTKSLQIRQYKIFLELKKLIRTCKTQNDGKNYIGHTNKLHHELIRFNPCYDNVSEMLERLEAV